MMKGYVIVVEREGIGFAIGPGTTDLNEAIEIADKIWEIAIQKESFRVKVCIVNTDDFIYTRFKGGERNDDGMQSRD